MKIYAIIVLAIASCISGTARAELSASCTCQSLEQSTETICEAQPQTGPYKSYYQPLGGAVISFAHPENPFATFHCSRRVAKGGPACTLQVTVVGPSQCSLSAKGDWLCSKDLASSTTICNSARKSRLPLDSATR